MKKILIISILLGSIILSGCNSQRWLSQNELFENRQKCLNYTNEIQKEILSWNNEISSYNIEQIFFSPEKQQCFIVINNKDHVDQELEIEWKILYEYWNHFSNSKPIKWCSRKFSSNESCENFDKYIKKLKWE